VERAGTYRNLKTLDQVFVVTLAEALELLATKGGPAELKNLGAHPETGVELAVLDGRYGPYVTDGEVNASLPKGEDPETFTLEDAVALLAAAKAKGKGRRGRGRGGPKGAKGAKGAKGTKEPAAAQGSRKSTKKGASRRKASDDDEGEEEGG
jgi:DNA topoisomerase-1